ncbi:hypothetical protein ACFOZ0_12655 [Streptomyces yaanensis]|uniref:Uncharacterized protein n=1 Tax=Streptomyces yaanensis TaxID=1142239 RepID=A0ABV7SD86_9ACTN|nr:hypothetical protein [Streptomyces sp. CGMCC 4.7035]WNB99032.1 hypothetical protein Q2K21_13640 [Streptomyces sp. CGMCC 4.7035]
MQESDEPSPVRDPVFERMLDRALDSPEIAAALDGAGVVAGADEGAGASRERLRAQALEVRDRLVGVPADEYDRYLALRAAAIGRHGPSYGDGRTKDGLLPVLAVLVPSLGAVATGVFLLCGFGLRAFAARPHIGDGLVMAGVIAAAVTAGAALGDLAWLLAARARGRSGPCGDDPAERDPEVRRAREAWELAVLERGLVPFLHECVDAWRGNAGRGNAGRGNAGRGNAGRAGDGRVRGGRADAGRVRDGRADPGPLGAERADAGRVRDGRAGGGRAETGRARGGRAETGRVDAGRVDVGRADPGDPDEGRAAGAEERTR